jgi:polysaccharide export outer membrane protein
MKMNRNFKVITSILLLLISGSVVANGEVVDDGSEYRLSVGDRIMVTVFGHEDLSGEFEVSGSEVISMPLIADIAAAGLTANELEESIVSALRPDYLKNPSVSVEVINYRPIYVLGEVASPGSYPYTNRMTVVNAIATAGGFTYRAKKKAVIIRREEGDRTIELEASLDTAVLPGDVLEIPERFF